MLGEEDNILYIGKARNLKKRVTSYFSRTQKDTKTAALLQHVHNIELIVTHSENEALLLESNLIKKHKPHYNVLFRDDKSYPYILITTDHPYPRIDFYRGQKKNQGRYFGPYPNSTAVRETINLIQKIFQLRTCTDSFFSARSRPCLLHQIGRCSGPCVDLISAEEYQQNIEHAIWFLEGKNQQIIKELETKMEKLSEALAFEQAGKLRDQIIKLRQIQERQYVATAQGEVDVVSCKIHAGVACVQLLIIRGGRILGSRSYFPLARINLGEEEVLSAFLTQHYLLNITAEEIPKEIIINKKLPDQTWLSTALSEHAHHKVIVSASVRGERKKWLEIGLTNARQAIANKLINKTNTLERFQALQAVLGFAKLPKRIECFDISHSMGEATVGSCVVFGHEGPVKNDYRRFNVTDVTAGDDVAAMQQVLHRRYKRLQEEHSKLPDVILIDGGKGQLNIAAKVLKELQIDKPFLVGVAKGVSRKPGYETLYFVDQPPIHLASDSLALHLIQQIRDEAHRFAITGHRMRRDKKRRTSTLEDIPGIGAKRRRELLRYFGGIQGLNRASLDELAKVPGISPALAAKIFDILSRT